MAQFVESVESVPGFVKEYELVRDRIMLELAKCTGALELDQRLGNSLSSARSALPSCARFVLNHIIVHTSTHSPGMSSLAYTTSSLPSTERIDQGSEFQRQGYVSFPCNAYELVRKHGSRAAVHIRRRSTSSMIIRFLTFFIFIDRSFLMEMAMTMPVS
jgi:hypothetical protein